MKFVQYIPLGCLAVLMIVGAQYASKQATTMRMLVDARTGLSADPAGMVLVNKNLETEAITVAKTRADALKANQEAQMLTRRAMEDLDAATSSMEKNKLDMEEIEEKLATVETTVQGIREESDKMLENLRSIPLLADADVDRAVDILKEYVDNYNTEFDQIKSELDKKEKERESLTTEVSGLTTSLAGKKEANQRFLDTYRRNGEEYTIEAVDPQWHFVVFKAPENNGFYAGDPEPLIVERAGVAITKLRIVSVSGGKVIAEYDEKSLPRGVQLEIGDRVFRQKPYGS